MKKSIKILIIVLVVLIILVIAGIVGANIWYKSSLKGVNSKENAKLIVVEITSGQGTEKIAEMLEAKNVIKNAFSFKVYVKLNKINNLKAGKYELDNSLSVKDITQKIVNGEVMDETVKLTFVEGKTIEDYIEMIASKTDNTEEEIYTLLKDEEYINSLIEKYWFLSEEIKNEDIYNALEGYLKADTYVFENKEVSAKYIFNYVLNYTDKLLTKYKEDIESSKYSVHELLTLASIVELEGSKDEERAGIAGVFYNRLNSNMSLGSDVTTYYAFHKKMADGDLTKEELNTVNPYNTRARKYEWKTSSRSNM